MQSADTQDSNVLGGAVMTADGRDDDGSANTLADLPPSYTSKSATLPLDSRVADDELALDDDDWQADHDEPVRSIEFVEDSEDEVPDFRDSPLEHSDMAMSGSSQLAPVTETAIDDDYELIHVQPSRHHHHPHHHPRSHHDPVQPTDDDLDPRSQSPAMASFHASRRASPAPSDASGSRHHTPVDPRPGSRGGHPKAHKPPPPPPPPRRHHLEDDVPTIPFDPFESLPPPAEMMLEREELDEDVEEPEDPDTDQFHVDDDEHHYWPASKPTDL